jgi:riboflavin biosynthesis pyrimidine reductase
MRELWPEPIEDVEPGARYGADPRPPHPTRPWVTVNMIASVDGATAVDGRSGGLGGSGDKAVFRALRALPDVIVVGASTVRAEGYGPPRPSEEVRASRTARGQNSAPRLVVISGRADLDPDLGLFADAEQPPLVFTGTAARPEHLAALDARAELVVGPGPEVDLVAVLADLHRRGSTEVLCEGGPSLNAQVVALDLVDEWCLSVAPWLAAGTSSRAAQGATPAAPRALTLHRVLSDDDGYLFVTYRRA